MSDEDSFDFSSLTPEESAEYDEMIYAMLEDNSGHDVENCIEEDCSYCGNPKNNVGDKWDIEYVD